jgi:hypothetical protein
MRFILVVNKFALKLKQAIPLYRPDMLNTVQINSINDKAVFMKSQGPSQKALNHCTRTWITERSCCGIRFQNKIHKFKHHFKQCVILFYKAKIYLYTFFENLSQSIPVFTPENCCS